MTDTRYAPPTVPLERADRHVVPVFRFVAIGWVLELVSFIPTGFLGLSLSNASVMRLSIATLSAWFILVALAWLTSRQKSVARKVLLWLLVPMILYLLLELVVSATIVPRELSAPFWGWLAGAGIHLGQLLLSAAAIWSLRRTRAR